jgi:2-hydroxy-6-oxonona-2,4-dienedioate hydrolase
MTRGIAVAEGRPADRPNQSRAAEAALWGRYGLSPTERFLALDHPRLRVRALEHGRGRPLLLIHGTVGPAAWAPFVKAMGDGYRFVVVDRPGWGASEPLDYGRYPDYHAVAAQIQREVMDALGIERAVVIGGSIGDVWALSLAERDPERVDRVVLLGGGPLIAEVVAPSFIRLLASPIGAVVVRLPMTPSRTRTILVDSGHAASLAEGRVPDEFIDYRVALTNRSRAMRYERAMVRAIVRHGAWRPDLLFDAAALGRIEAPTLMLSGSNDTVGDAEMWRRFTGAMPNGAFAAIEGAGHMPWFDEPSEIADRVRAFLGP